MSAPGSYGEEYVHPLTIKGLTTIDVYAALFDNDMFIQNVDALWSACSDVRGDISGFLNITTGTNTSFLALDNEETITITADCGCYGTVHTSSITVDNKIYLMHSLFLWNYNTCGGSPAGATWQVNGGQGSLGGSYALINYAWPDVTGLPQDVTEVRLYIYKYDTPPCYNWTMKYAIFPVVNPWNASDHYGDNKWSTKPAYDPGNMKGYYDLHGSYLYWFNIDITSYYNTEWFNTGFYGFTLYTDTAWPSDSFHTICGPSYSEASFRPYLEVTKDGNTVKFVFTEL
jgi:hypothetical protein